MPPSRLQLPARCFAPRLLLALALSLAPLDAADPALSNLVKKFTEKHSAQPVSQPVAQSIAQPVALPVAQAVAQPVATTPTLDPEAKKPGARKPSPPLASLPAPKAGGPRRILLVDDDWNGNTVLGATRPSGSDKIFRELVAAAVGGDAAAWSTEMVEIYKHGPAFERLRDFNVVIWYTGESYGGGADSVSTLSVADERTVRRYLQEVGGAFVLVSPGFLTTRTYGTTWTESDNAFLKEVMGINGFTSLAQRFAAGTVRAADGASFEVAAKGVVETQFSAVNPDGAAVVFGATLDPKRTAEGAVPVAVAHPFGSGRFVYVGFSFENIAEAGRAKAFDLLLDAATGQRAAVAGALQVTPTILRGEVGSQRVVEAPPPASPPPPPVPESTGETAPDATEPNPKLLKTGLTYFRTAKVKIYTGNDNKEAPSNVTVELYINGSATDDNYGLNPDRLTQLARFFLPKEELRVNSIYESVMETSPNQREQQFEYVKVNAWGEQDIVSLALCQQYGLRIDILYEPNFILDAWKIDRVDLEIEFAYWEWWNYATEQPRRLISYQKAKTAASFPRVISFSRSALLNNSNKKLTLIADRFFFPKP